MTTDPLDLYRGAAAGFGSRVHAVGSDQWEGPTPCSEWDVRELVNHLVGENRWVPEMFAGRTVAEVGDHLDGDLLGADPVAAWDSSITAALDAIGEGGAMERMVHLSFGDLPGAEYVMQLFADLLIHGWDLARAIGADEHLDDTLVAACATWFEGAAELYRTAGVVGPQIEVGETADPQAKLLSAFGRDPSPA
ncbi:MAG: TIGR03086 family metal-binding protein [Actinomycetota bacterium]|nr:TIGR03086 family metal-binding protein [Actinomycetota bacterium]